MANNGVQVGETAPVSKEIQSLPESVKTQARDAVKSVSDLMDKLTQHRPENSGAIPANGSDGKEALMHLQGAPGKSQEAMSPTDHHKGQTATQAKAPSKGQSRGM